MLFDEREAFFRTLQDRAVFSRGTATSEPVDVVIRYSEVRPEVISGEILGNNRTYESLKPVFDDRSDAYCSVASAFPHGREQVSSTKVWLRRLTHRGWGVKLPANEPLTVVGQFECEDLLIDEPLGEPEVDRRTRTATFYLSENAELWRRGGRDYDFRCFKLDSYQETIDLGGEHALKIVAEPALVYDRYRTATERIAAVIVPTLTCTTARSMDSYPNERFIEEATATVDDISLLASVVSRCLIRWHRYEWLGQKGLQSRVQPLGSHASARGVRPADPGEMPVPIAEFADFARQGVAKLQTFRAQGFDLSLPIVYLVASHQTPILDERFSYALLCLERLVDHHAQSRDLSQIVETKGFDTLRRALRAHIEAQVHATPSLIVAKSGRPMAEACALMQEKLPELNRPPFWTVLSSLLDEHGVAWADLYPPDVPRPTFINTRNKFIHSSETLAPKLLFREALRVQAVCERLILRMLGWKNPHSPMSYIRQSLAKP